MTEAEVWQVLFLAREMAYNAASSGILGNSGYVTAAYFVGARPSRSQAALVTAIYLYWEWGALSFI